MNNMTGRDSLWGSPVVFSLPGSCRAVRFLARSLSYAEKVVFLT